MSELPAPRKLMTRDELSGEYPEAEVKAVQAQLVKSAQLEMDTQAQRAAEFEVQYRAALKRAERQEKLDKGFKPLTPADLKRMLKRWMFSTCIPGRILPHLGFGPNYRMHREYVPIERRIVYAMPNLGMRP